MKEIGIVFIGRNEGDRLKRCVSSLPLGQAPAVYVDSGSTDESVALCRAHGIQVVELDMSRPFTAARARNAGFEKLMEDHPQVELVQFIDGDCQLVGDWLKKASHFLERNPGYGAVCGRRKEIHPQASVYNELCDIEWDTPVGEAVACGGDVLIRVAAFEAAGMYREDMIAGEDPELCFRIRQKNWRIYRLDALMTLHDANIRHFSQWWKRTRRAGYAYMKGALLHGRSLERYNLRPVIRNVFWAAAYPLVTLILALLNPWALLLLLAYPAHWLKIATTGERSPATNLLWAFFIVLGKFPEFVGMLQCLKDTCLSQHTTLIEYK